MKVLIFVLFIIQALLIFPILADQAQDILFKIPGDCGNGNKDAGEQCDTNDFGGLTCASYNYNSGSLTCTGSCVIDFTGCYNSGGGGGGGYIPPIDEIIVTDKDPVIELRVRLVHAVINPSIKIRLLTNLTVTKPKGILYKSLNITKSNFENQIIKNATIDFKVENSWIIKNKIAKVYLLKYDTGWKKLKTELLNKTENYTYYRAYPDSFSYFAITGEEEILLCVENQKRCYEDNLEECVDDSWQSIEVCEFGCNNITLTCNLKPEPIETLCGLGEERCFGDKLQECKEGLWITLEVCEYGCNETLVDCNSEPIRETSKPGHILYFLIFLMTIEIALILYILNKKWKNQTVKRKYFTPSKLKLKPVEKPGSVKEIEEKIQELEKKISALKLGEEELADLRKDLNSARYDLKLYLIFLAKYRINRVIRKLKNKSIKDSTSK